MSHHIYIESRHENTSLCAAAHPPQEKSHRDPTASIHRVDFLSGLRLKKNNPACPIDENQSLEGNQRN